MSSTNRDRVKSAPSLQPTRYDRAASLLISTLILTGSSVAVLVVLWLATPPEIAKPLPLIGRDGAGRGAGSPDLGELAEPNRSELSQVAVIEPIAEISRLLSRESIAAVSTLDIGGAVGDNRPPGPPAPPEAVPRWDRWEIRYDASSIESYARQLDFFKIELGAAGGGQKHVDYASRVSDTTPKTRNAAGDAETRLYFAWRGGTLQAMDRKLLLKAGVDVERRIVLQFYPKEVEETLARLEKEYAKDGQVDKLRKTVFGVRRNGDGYELFIIEQR